jgi:hypothetical protein
MVTFSLPARVAVALDIDSDVVECHLSSLKEDGSVELSLTGEQTDISAAVAQIKSALG